MKLTRKIPKVLFALLLTIFFGLFAWMILRAQTHSSQLPNTPTVVSNTHFAVDIPQKALWRNYVWVSVEATPGTNCRLIYVPPSGEIQVMGTVANTSGKCVWRWKVEASQGKGAARLIFTINGVSDTHFMEILSEF